MGIESELSFDSGESLGGINKRAQVVIMA